MKKIIVTLTLCIIVIFQCIGQKGKITIGIGPSIGFPIFNKNFSYYYKTGIGGRVQANFGITKLGSITTGITIVSIGAKNLPVSKTFLTFIKGGYRTNFSNSDFFAATDAGLASYGSGGSSHFVIGGTFGYTFKLPKGSTIDLFPTYNLIFGTGNNNMWLMANVLYRFNLKKKK